MHLGQQDGMDKPQTPQPVQDMQMGSKTHPPPAAPAPLGHADLKNTGGKEVKVELRLLLGALVMLWQKYLFAEQNKLEASNHLGTVIASSSTECCRHRKNATSPSGGPLSTCNMANPTKIQTKAPPCCSIRHTSTCSPSGFRVACYSPWLPCSFSAYAMDGMMTYGRFSGRADHSQRKALLLTLLILLALATARMHRSCTLLFSSTRKNRIQAHKLHTNWHQKMQVSFLSSNLDNEMRYCSFPRFLD